MIISHSSGILSVLKSFAINPIHFRSVSFLIYDFGLIYLTISIAFFWSISLILSFNLLSDVSVKFPLYLTSPIMSMPFVLTSNTFLVPISIIVCPSVSGFL